MPMTFFQFESPIWSTIVSCREPGPISFVLVTTCERVEFGPPTLHTLSIRSACSLREVEGEFAVALVDMRGQVELWDQERDSNASFIDTPGGGEEFPHPSPKVLAPLACNIVGDNEVLLHRVA